MTCFQRFPTLASPLGLARLSLGWLCLLVACSRSSDPVAEGRPDLDATAQLDSAPTPLVVEPQVYEVSAEQLLAARLPAEKASEGWIRLFDGHTLFGWEIAGSANFRVEEGSIVADAGEICLLCTSIPWRDYELLVEFRAQEDTNSGVFLRTPLAPQDMQTDCYEVNIAPDDNPFPTASIVGRQKADDQVTPQPYNVWRTMGMRLEGDRLQITLDDELVCEYVDPLPLPAGRIGLQHNRGRIEFREVMLRPLGWESLLDENLTRWKQYPEMEARFSVTDEGYLHIQGGSGQLETTDLFGDFVLQAQYKLATPAVNSGIFFRCIPGDTMMGYECQINDEMKDGNPLAPADCGTGGIFRRQDARVVAGEPDQWSTVVLAAKGASMAAWVNGLQVSDWTDDRPADENPRRGKRTDPGTIILQGHDSTTDALIRQFRIVPLDETSEP